MYTVSVNFLRLSALRTSKNLTERCCAPQLGARNPGVAAQNPGIWGMIRGAPGLGRFSVNFFHARPVQKAKMLTERDAAERGPAPVAHHEGLVVGRAGVPGDHRNGRRVGKVDRHGVSGERALPSSRRPGAPGIDLERDRERHRAQGCVPCKVGHKVKPSDMLAGPPVLDDPRMLTIGAAGEALPRWRCCRSTRDRKRLDPGWSPGALRSPACRRPLRRAPP